VGTAVGTWMFVVANLTPNFPLAISDYTFPGYSALYTVINALGSAQTDATVAADYRT
jgi:hypothetical protein